MGKLCWCDHAHSRASGRKCARSCASEVLAFWRTPGGSVTRQVADGAEEEGDEDEDEEADVLEASDTSLGKGAQRTYSKRTCCWVSAGSSNSSSFRVARGHWTRSWDLWLTDTGVRLRSLRTPNSLPICGARASVPPNAVSETLMMTHSFSLLLWCWSARNS